MMPKTFKIYPVILSGGAGTRLWPLSRESFPKQLLPLIGEKTLLQEAALRGQEPEIFAPLLVVANAEHRFQIAEQLREIGVADATIVLEPTARNTAAAVATAALILSRRDPEAVMLVMPADHHVTDLNAFHRAVIAGKLAAADGSLVLFGVPPAEPSIAYGYVRCGSQLTQHGTRAVTAFKEKPDRATAEAYFDSGDYLWNSGIFLLPTTVVLSEIAEHAPEVLACAQAALAGAVKDIDFIRLDRTAFCACPSISIDHAVLEKTKLATLVPVDFGWADVGSWTALWEIASPDEDGNIQLGDVHLEATSGSYIRSEGPLITAVGVRDLVVVATSDAVLVAPMSADQEVKIAIENLRARGHAAATQARRVYRPWGWYEGVHSGERFQVKRITVSPGQTLSLQKHFHRAEHWVVVNGTARITVGEVDKLLGENESVYIPLGAVHRLANPGKVPLNLIEVQSGTYLGEDDIVRFDDVYARP